MSDSQSRTTNEHTKMVRDTRTAGNVLAVMYGAAALFAFYTAMQPSRFLESVGYGFATLFLLALTKFALDNSAVLMHESN